ncbi:DUF4238 domain-containing protein [Shewanella polaris]|uniref:DUF4238 domain-containing protein n=1 Tax=Shewanella polaris TaxID=2588449 RepID=A0A4Y5YG09_9GAMM|nr:DUF4238 domain-containing protein [Shewanella polaris]QDE31731.1 DUF4238 domain-containing protein [Shewanella polaris]
MIKGLRKLFPDIEDKQAQALVEIWEEVVDLIFHEMDRISQPQMTELHINLREEIILEFAKLRHHIESKVIEAQTLEQLPNEIDLAAERELCLGDIGQQKILNTGKIIAENVWLEKYHNRWKLKTRSALEKEKAPPVAKELKINEVTDNHFIPKSFIKRYWSEKGVIRKNSISKGVVNYIDTSFGKWGFVRNLYSDQLEAYFGLIEGDASVPIQKVLKVEPLNTPQKQALVGFIVIQRIRNPAFIDSHNAKLKPVIEQHCGVEKANNPEYVQFIYESIFKNHEVYRNLSKPLFHNQWVLVRSPQKSIVLPDTCNIFTDVNGETFIVVPLTVSDCLVILPKKADEFPWPWYVTATPELERLLLCFGIEHSHTEFLSSTQQDIVTVEIVENSSEKIINSILRLAKSRGVPAK